MAPRQAVATNERQGVAEPSSTTPKRDAVPDPRAQAIADRESEDEPATAEELRYLREAVENGVIDKMPDDPEAFIRGQRHVGKLMHAWMDRMGKVVV